MSSYGFRIGKLLLLLTSLPLVFFGYQASLELIAGNNLNAAEWSVAIGTTLLAIATIWTILSSRETTMEQESRSMALKQLDDYYSPLIKIFSAYPESVKENREVVAERANELVSILKGRRHLALPATLDAIPDNVEHIAYFNWLYDKSGQMVFSPDIGYLVFANIDERAPWCSFLKQMWKDYESIVSNIFENHKQEEPKWHLRIKGVKAKQTEIDECTTENRESNIRAKNVGVKG